jgi:hypothetical protein
LVIYVKVDKATLVVSEKIAGSCAILLWLDRCIGCEVRIHRFIEIVLKRGFYWKKVHPVRTP